MNALKHSPAETQKETFIIARTGEEYRVCSPLTPAKQFIVSGVPDAPQCTCPEFSNQTGDREWLCPHILAVLEQAGVPAERVEPKPENRDVTPSRSRTEKKPSDGRKSNGAVMLLKRSVSPDGRIDSLSVEFSCPVGEVTADGLRQRAEKILALQGEIAADFLKTKANGNDRHDNHAESAQLLGIASMNGKWGPRLFLNVLVKGQVLRLFGNEKQLAEAISEAGFPSVGDHIADGLMINQPCRVTTRPSPDGKYLNVERLLPAQAK